MCSVKFICLPVHIRDEMAYKNTTTETIGHIEIHVKFLGGQIVQEISVYEDHTP